MARKFLYLIAIAIGLIIVLLMALRFWAEDLSELAFVPNGPFQAPPPLAAYAYDDPAMWISRPGQGAQDPARWLPQGYHEAPDELNAAVFFVHPSSYMERKQWNAPPGDSESRWQAQDYVRAMASAFNRSADLWAPRYRQAAFGTFLTDAPESARAIDLAYGDVRMAFDHFVAHVAPSKPMILAGEGQGAFLLRRLLAERVAGKPLADRVAAVYVSGWPISREHDLPVLGLPACTAPEQSGCVMSWLSFAEPADATMALKSYGRRPGLDGKPLKGAAFVCTNPLTGGGGPAPAGANPGTLVPDKSGANESLVPGVAGARCAADGLLMIGDPPQVGNRVQPGNDYRAYDISLFWAALRADATHRVEAWQSRR
jgi:hypothetical protein